MSSTTVEDTAHHIALGFNNLIVKCDNPKKNLLNGITGFVEAGGVTAGRGLFEM